MLAVPLWTRQKTRERDDVTVAFTDEEVVVEFEIATHASHFRLGSAAWGDAEKPKDPDTQESRWLQRHENPWIVG